ncbi:MAG: class I SAM-dependent methyltransferase [Promethearchaeota archaeon]
MVDLPVSLGQCPIVRWIRYLLLWIKGGSEQPEAWKGDRSVLRRITYGRHVDDEKAWSLTGSRWIEKWIMPPVASYKRADWHILEIGCGPGRLLLPLAEHFEKVIGIDFSNDMIDYARHRLRRLHNVEVIRNDGRTIPLPDSSVDFIISVIAFQHMDLSTIKSYFREAYRVLRNRGFFRFQTRRDLERRNASPYDRHFLAKTEGENLALDYGFELFSYEPGLGHPKWHWFTLRKTASGH